MNPLTKLRDLVYQQRYSEAFRLIAYTKLSTVGKSYLDKHNFYKQIRKPNQLENGWGDGDEHGYFCGEGSGYSFGDGFLWSYFTDRGGAGNSFYAVHTYKDHFRGFLPNPWVRS